MANTPDLVPHGGRGRSLPWGGKRLLYDYYLQNTSIFISTL